MTKESTSGPLSRIEQLRTKGQLDPSQARVLGQAFGRPAGDSPEQADASGSPEGSAQRLTGTFLEGGVTEESLRESARLTGRRMGVMFGVIMGVMFGVVLGWERSIWAKLTIGLLSSVPLGVAFGYAMFLLQIRPAVSRQIALHRESGDLAAIPFADAGQCPTCRSEEFRHLTWRNPSMLHWILNPGLAVNELAFGQRIPAELNICRQCMGQSVDCNHCHRAIDGMHWSGKGAFGHWGGLRCPHCDASLPCLSNAVAWVIRLPFTLLAKLGGQR
ncbi:MAG: hypothetical protein ACI9F9_001501 [Candidatus Paceibacteria bacterium]|jgi:hypothetical protein